MRREQEIINSLTKAGIEKERITLLKDKTDKELMQFFIVPAGAQIPTVDEQ